MMGVLPVASRFLSVIHQPMSLYYMMVDTHVRRNCWRERACARTYLYDIFMISPWKETNRGIGLLVFFISSSLSLSSSLRMQVVNLLSFETKLFRHMCIVIFNEKHLRLCG